tara:strand:- start:31342 stop:31539 length:198 start_codon:yes stop_codon:yes gene_type:complete
MSSNVLTDSQLANLRQTGVITDQEIALLEGDILVAKNVVTEERRIIGNSSDLLSEGSDNKRVLKG